MQRHNSRDCAMSDRFRSIAPYAALSGAVFLLYLKSIGFGFVPTWDDGDYVTNNPDIQGLDMQHLAAILSKIYVGNYAPLHLLSYSLDYALWGLNPTGYHLSNILLHGLNACACFALVGRLTGRKTVGLAAALLMSLHPLNVENVAWITERKTLLSTLLFFIAFSAYLRFRDTGRQTFYAISVAAYALAALSKASVVVLPALLALYELILVKKGRRWSAILPFLVISAAAAAAVLWAHRQDKAFEEGILSPAVLFGTVYPSMLPVYWKYIGKLLWPFNLSGYYDTTVYHAFTALPVIISLSLWAIVFSIVLLRGDEQTRFWFGWYWICLLPVSNLVPLLVYYADRYMYTPAIGLFVIAAFQAVRIWDAVKSSSGKAFLFIGTTLCSMLFLAGISYTRLEVWRNELTFWEDTSKKSPKQYKARLNLGVTYEKSGRLAEAENEYLAALELFRNDQAESYLRSVRAKRALNEDLKIYR